MSPDMHFDSCAQLRGFLFIPRAALCMPELPLWRKYLLIDELCRILLPCQIDCTKSQCANLVVLTAQGAIPVMEYSWLQTGSETLMAATSRKYSGSWTWS
eukprot:IDg9695t1